MPQSQIVEGVGLILENRQGEIFCVRELVSKPETGKAAQSLSIPCETLGRHESRDEALKRLVREEVDGRESLVCSPPAYLGAVSWLAGKAVAYVYRARLLSEHDEATFRGTHAGIEIEPVGFLAQAELLREGRLGMREIFAIANILEKCGL